MLQLSYILKLSHAAVAAKIYLLDAITWDGLITLKMGSLRTSIQNVR